MNFSFFNNTIFSRFTDAIREYLKTDLSSPLMTATPVNWENVRIEEVSVGRMITEALKEVSGKKREFAWKVDRNTWIATDKIGIVHVGTVEECKEKLCEKLGNYIGYKAGYSRRDMFEVRNWISSCCIFSLEKGTLGKRDILRVVQALLLVAGVDLGIGPENE